MGKSDNIPSEQAEPQREFSVEGFRKWAESTGLNVRGSDISSIYAQFMSLVEADKNKKAGQTAASAFEALGDDSVDLDGFKKKVSSSLQKKFREALTSIVKEEEKPPASTPPKTESTKIPLDTPLYRATYSDDDVLEFRIVKKESRYEILQIQQIDSEDIKKFRGSYKTLEGAAASLSSMVQEIADSPFMRNARNGSVETLHNSVAQVSYKSSEKPPASSSGADDEVVDDETVEEEEEEKNEPKARRGRPPAEETEGQPGRNLPPYLDELAYAVGLDPSKMPMETASRLQSLMYEVLGNDRVVRAYFRAQQQNNFLNSSRVISGKKKGVTRQPLPKIDVDQEWIIDNAIKNITKRIKTDSEFDLYRRPDASDLSVFERGFKRLALSQGVAPSALTDANVKRLTQVFLEAPSFSGGDGRLRGTAEALLQHAADESNEPKTFKDVIGPARSVFGRAFAEAMGEARKVLTAKPPAQTSRPPQTQTGGGGSRGGGGNNNPPPSTDGVYLEFEDENSKKTWQIFKPEGQDAYQIRVKESGKEFEDYANVAEGTTKREVVKFATPEEAFRAAFTRASQDQPKSKDFELLSPGEYAKEYFRYKTPDSNVLAMINKEVSDAIKAAQEAEDEEPDKKKPTNKTEKAETEAAPETADILTDKNNRKWVATETENGRYRLNYLGGDDKKTKMSNHALGGREFSSPEEAADALIRHLSGQDLLVEGAGSNDEYNDSIREGIENSRASRASIFDEIEAEEDTKEARRSESRTRGKITPQREGYFTERGEYVLGGTAKVIPGWKAPQVEGSSNVEYAIREVHFLVPQERTDLVVKITDGKDKGKEKPLSEVQKGEKFEFINASKAKDPLIKPKMKYTTYEVKRTFVDKNGQTQTRRIWVPGGTHYELVYRPLAHDGSARPDLEWRSISRTEYGDTPEEALANNFRMVEEGSTISDTATKKAYDKWAKKNPEQVAKSTLAIKPERVRVETLEVSPEEETANEWARQESTSKKTGEIRVIPGSVQDRDWTAYDPDNPPDTSPTQAQIEDRNIRRGRLLTPQALPSRINVNLLRVPFEVKQQLAAIRTGSDDPASLTEEAVKEALKEWRADLLSPSPYHQQRALQQADQAGVGQFIDRNHYKTQQIFKRKDAKTWVVQKDPLDVQTVAGRETIPGVARLPVYDTETNEPARAFSTEGRPTTLTNAEGKPISTSEAFSRGRLFVVPEKINNKTVYRLASYPYGERGLILRSSQAGEGKGKPSLITYDSWIDLVIAVREGKHDNEIFDHYKKVGTKSNKDSWFSQLSPEDQAYHQTLLATALEEQANKYEHAVSLEEEILPGQIERLRALQAQYKEITDKIPHHDRHTLTEEQEKLQKVIQTLESRIERTKRTLSAETTADRLIDRYMEGVSLEGLSPDEALERANQILSVSGNEAVPSLTREQSGGIYDTSFVSEGINQQVLHHRAAKSGQSREALAQIRKRKRTRSSRLGDTTAQVLSPEQRASAIERLTAIPEDERTPRDTQLLEALQAVEKAEAKKKAPAKKATEVRRPANGVYTNQSEYVVGTYNIPTEARSGAVKYLPIFTTMDGTQYGIGATSNNQGYKVYIGKLDAPSPGPGRTRVWQSLTGEDGKKVAFSAANGVEGNPLQQAFEWLADNFVDPKQQEGEDAKERVSANDIVPADVELSADDIARITPPAEGSADSIQKEVGKTIRVFHHQSAMDAFNDRGASIDEELRPRRNEENKKSKGMDAASGGGKRKRGRPKKQQSGSSADEIAGAGGTGQSADEIAGAGGTGQSADEIAASTRINVEPFEVNYTSNAGKQSTYVVTSWDPKSNRWFGHTKGNANFVHSLNPDRVKPLDGQTLPTPPKAAAPQPPKAGEKPSSRQAPPPSAQTGAPSTPQNNPIADLLARLLRPAFQDPRLQEALNTAPPDVRTLLEQVFGPMFGTENNQQPAPSSEQKSKKEKGKPAAVRSGQPAPPAEGFDVLRNALRDLLFPNGPPDSKGQTAQTSTEKTAAEQVLSDMARGITSAAPLTPDRFLPPELVGLRSLLGLPASTSVEDLKSVYNAVEQRFSSNPTAISWLRDYTTQKGRLVSQGSNDPVSVRGKFNGTPEAQSILDFLEAFRQNIASQQPQEPVAGAQAPVSEPATPASVPQQSAPTSSAAAQPPQKPADQPRSGLRDLIGRGKEMLQNLAGGAKAQPASNAVGDLVDQAGTFKPPEMDSEKRAEMFRNIEAQKVQQAQRMADLAKTESPLQEPTPLSEKEVARRISEQPLMERLRGGYEDLKQGLANAAEQPVSFKGLTDFGRALIEPLNKPLFGSERPTPEQLRAQAMRGLQPEPGRQFGGEEVPEQRVWQDAAQRQTFQDVNDQILRANIEEFAPARSPRLSRKNEADFANLIEPDVTRDRPGVYTTRVSPLERPIGAAPRIEPGTRAGFDVLGEPMLAGGKFVPASSGIPEAPPPHILDRAMDKISRANQKAFIPLMLASEAIPEALEGNYGQAALNVGKGATTLGVLHYLNKTAEAVMNPELRMTMGDFLGSGKKGMEGWRGMAQTYQPSRLARLAPAASNLLNRGFGVLGGLGAAQQLWDDKGASADFMDKYYGGYLGRKALGATAMALGFVPWAGMALGAGDMVGRGIIDPIARKIGPDLSMLGLGSSYNNLGLKEAHGWNVSKEEGGLGQQLPIDDIKAEVRNTLQKAGSLIDPSTGRGTPQYTNMVEGMTKQLMDMGFSKESVVNMYNEVSGGAVKEQPGWLNTKAPSLTELKAQGIDPNAFATGALERYVNRRNMPRAIPDLAPQNRVPLAQLLGVPVVPHSQATVLNPGGFQPLLPSRRDINF